VNRVQKLSKKTGAVQCGPAAKVLTLNLKQGWAAAQSLGAPHSELEFYIPHRQATTGKDVACRHKRQWLFTVSDFTAD